MGSQQFCLKWNNHQSNMLVVFDQLLQNEAFVDVTLACEGISLKAHKMVLSACSPYFQNLFLENPCKHPIVILNSIRYCDLKAIVDFMYKGEVNVSQEQLSALLKTADALKVKGLAEVTNQTAKCLAESRPPPPSTPPTGSMSTNVQTNVQTSSPPPKRKKIRNGSAPSPPPPVHQHAKATSSDTNENDSRLMLSMSELAEDKSNNHEINPKLNEDETGQIQQPITIDHPPIPPQTELNMASSPESDDKSFLKGLQSDIVFEPVEGPVKDYQQLPINPATTLSTLLTTDQTHPQHSISLAPSTSGIQNPTPDARSIRIDSSMNETIYSHDDAEMVNDHQLARVHVQRRCRVCYHIRGERHESIYMCVTCKVHVCNPTRRNCYDIHHKLLGNRHSRISTKFSGMIKKQMKDNL